MQLKRNGDLDLTKIEYHIAITYFDGPTPSGADALETSVAEIEHSLKTSVLQKEAALLNTYYSLENLEDNIEIQKVNVKISKSNLSIINAKVKLNKATAIDELVASIDFSKAENKLQSLINEYMLAQASVNKELRSIVKTIK